MTQSAESSPMDQLNQQPPVSLGGQSTEQEKTALPVVSILTALLHVVGNDLDQVIT
eukprot:jgi/Botrbrau1/17215/Bobra.0401s0001.1